MEIKKKKRQTSISPIVDSMYFHLSFLAFYFPIPSFAEVKAKMKYIYKKRRKYFKEEWLRGENSQSETERLKVMQERKRGGIA